MKLTSWRESSKPLKKVSGIEGYEGAASGLTDLPFPGWRLTSARILCLGLILLTTACDEFTEADARRRKIKDSGITDRTDITGERTIEWRRNGQIAPGGPQGTYTLSFVGYPYNRLQLVGSTTYTQEGNRIEPVVLQTGELLPLEVRIGGESRTYVFQIAQLPSLPAGTYLLDLPGATEDIVSFAASQPGTPIAITLRGDTSGVQGGTAIPTAFRDAPGSGVSFSVTMNVSGVDAGLISTLPVTRPGGGVQYQQ